MNMLNFQLIALPFLLIPSAVLAFTFCSKKFGRERGYLIGFAFYWLIWCLLIPFLLLGQRELLHLLTDRSPLFSQDNWSAALLLVVITVVTMVMYYKKFIQASPTLILIAIPLAAINGVCEELLWRGLYIQSFSNNVWFAILYPALGFALWHLAPLQIFPAEGGKFTFVLSAFFLGLTYGWIAYATGSAKWTAISHSVNGILALSGMLAPSFIQIRKTARVFRL